MAIFMGIVLIIAGVCMLAAPVVAGTITVMIVGGLMTVAGVVECIRSLRTATMLTRVTWLLVGLVTLLCGVLVIAHPLLGLSFLTALLAIYFFADGLMKIIAAFNLVVHRLWFIGSGVLSFLLAYIIWSNWPVSGGWVVGVLVGINFIFTGLLAIAAGEELS